nr:GPCR kinase [Tanacetum cinerariifolium]
MRILMGRGLARLSLLMLMGRVRIGCVGVIKNSLKNEKLEQVIAIIKSSTLNALGDLTMTLRDLSDTISGNSSGIAVNEMLDEEEIIKMLEEEEMDESELQISLSQGEPDFVQAQQQEVSPPPPSPVVAPHPSYDPMPSPPRQSSPLPIPFGPAPSSEVAST